MMLVSWYDPETFGLVRPSGPAVEGRISCNRKVHGLSRPETFVACQSTSLSLCFLSISTVLANNGKKAPPKNLKNEKHLSLCFCKAYG